MTRTEAYAGLLAETTTVRGDGGDLIHAYLARPLGPGPFPAMVLFHHLPGWDDWYRQTTRLFASRGFLTICPDLYCRDGHGEPDDVAARVRAEGGVPDDRVVGDAAGCVEQMRSLQNCNGKVGFFGTCSGGRHAYLAACRLDGVDAVVDCWGGRIVAGEQELTGKQPVAPVDLTPDLDCPVLGLFGNEDHNPAPDQVDTLEAALKDHGKGYEFHRYPGAGHGFLYHDRPAAFHAESAADAWPKVWEFLHRELD